MKIRNLIVCSSVLSTAVLVAACGGGDDSVSSDGAAPAAAAPAAAGGAIGGVAAKGFLKKAIVSAYCGNSEAAADLLTTGATGAVGEYSIKWTGACTKPIKLVITADANTTMADEATGTDVTPPTGFKLRALVADPSNTAIKNITPLTDMAVAIAGTSTSLSKASVSSAETAVITAVLGGDIDAYQAAPLASTVAGMANASAAEKKLATLLTVISAFAQDDATCKLKTSAGDKIKCATDTFSAQAAATVTGVSDTGYIVATTVPTNTPASMLAATLTKITNGTITGVTATGAQALSTDITKDTAGSAALLASGTASVVKSASTPGGAVLVASTTGIQAARDLLNSLKNDLYAISNGSGTGYLDKKLSEASADWSANGLGSAKGFIDFMTAINRATAMAKEAKTATWAVAGTLQPNSAYLVPNSTVILETDSTGAPRSYLRSFRLDNMPTYSIACPSFAVSASCAAAITATMKSQAAQSGMTCRVLASEKASGKAGCYFSAGKPNVPLTATSFTGYYHAVEVAESATTSGTYEWQDYTASREYTTTLFAAPSGYSIPLLGNAVYVPGTAAPIAGTKLTGAASLTKDSSGKVTALAIKGDIQPLSATADKSALDISGALTTAATTQTMAFTGAVSNVKGATTTAAMALTTGSQIVGTLATPTANEHVTSATLILKVKTTAFEFDGNLAMDSFVLEKGSSGNYQPTNANFTGKISSLANGTATEFLSGTLGAKVANMADFDPSKAKSATNFLKETASFTGSVTTGSTIYALTFSVDQTTYGQQSATINYTGAGNRMANVVITKVDATNATTVTIKGSGDVNATIANSSGDIKTGTTTVGSIAKGQVNFTDGTYILLSI